MPTVLIVEDEPAVRRIAARVLGNHGFRVLEAGTALDAIALAQTEPIDVLLSDLILPGMSGLDLAMALRAERPGLRVVFTSGYPADQVEERFGVIEGAFLAKPYGMEQLVGVVRGEA